MSSWRSEVTNGNGCWIANRLRFATLDEAAAYVSDQRARWHWVTDTRIIASDEPARYRYINGELLLKIEVKVQPAPEKVQS